MSFRLFGFVLFTGLGALVQAQTSHSEEVVTGAKVEVQDSRLDLASLEVSRIKLPTDAVRTDVIQNIAQTSANFYIADSGARSFTNSVSLRGLSNTPLFGDPAVTVYLDELPLGSAFTFPTELAGFDSAELTRGLGHNTRVGRAGTTGVLQLTTPESASNAFALEAAAGNYASHSATARAHVRDGGVEVFAAAAYSARDGYIDNVQLDRDIDHRESSSGLVRIRFAATDTVELSFLAVGQKVRDGVQPLVPLNTTMFEVDRSAEGETPMDSFAFAGTAAFDTALGRVTATSAYTDWDLGPATNVLNLGFAEMHNATRFAQRNWSEEIRLVSAEGSAIAWSAGVFGLDGETEGAFTRSIFGAPFERSAFSIDHESLSAFGEATLSLRPALRLTAGLRAEANWKTMHRSEEVPTVNRYERSTTSSAVLPKLALAYDLSAQTTATLGLGASYKPGGFSAFTGNRALSRFGAERAEGLDFAVAHRPANQPWFATVRAYAYRVKGFQIERSFQTGGMADDYLVVNADRARSVGAEIEAVWTPLTGLTLEASLGYSHVTLREFRDPYTDDNYKGRRAPNAPSHDAALSVEYRWSNGFFVEAGLTHVGRTYYTEGEQKSFAQTSYTLLNGRAGMTLGRFEVAAYVENATDREYYSSILPGTFHGTPGAPRTYGLQAALRF